MQQCDSRLAFKKGFVTFEIRESLREFTRLSLIDYFVLKLILNQRDVVTFIRLAFRRP